MVKPTLILLPAVLLFVFSSCHTRPENKLVVAKINDFEITEDHFKNSFLEYYYRTGQILKPDSRTRLTVLNSQFNNYVLATYAKDIGLDQTDEAYRKKGEIERRVLNEEYLNRFITADIKVTEAELHDYFVRFNTTLRASHLFAKDIETAQVLYKKLQSGESFESLAAETFQNEYLANNGGDIGRFTTDEMDIAFEEKAFELRVGEISEPVPTAQGYSIIKLTDRFTKPIITQFEFANKKDQIASYVVKKKKELMTRDHLYSFIEGARINEPDFDKLWKMMNDNYALAINKDSEFLSRISNKDVLATYNNRKFTFADFSVEYSFTPLHLIDSIEGKESFENFVIGTFLRFYLHDQALANKLHNDELIVGSINETYYIYLAQKAVNHLEAGISNTGSELRQEFFNNSSRFYKPLEVNLAQIVTDTEEKANIVRSQLLNGGSFKELLNEHTIFNEDLLTNGELGLQDVSNYGSYASEISKLSEGDISEIINYQTGQYTVYKMIDRVEAREMSFNEAKELVDKALTNKKLAELKSKTIEDVKKKHNAVIDIEKLNEIIIQI